MENVILLPLEARDREQFPEGLLRFEKLIG